MSSVLQVFETSKDKFVLAERQEGAGRGYEYSQGAPCCTGNKIDILVNVLNLKP